MEIKMRCDNKECEEWFHGKCVGQFKNKKKSRWHCPLCSGHWTGLWFKPKTGVTADNSFDRTSSIHGGRTQSLVATSPFKVTPLPEKLGVTSICSASGSTLVPKQNDLRSTVEADTSLISMSCGAISDSACNDTIVTVVASKTSTIKSPLQPPLQGIERPNKLCSTSPFKVTPFPENLAATKTSSNKSIQPPLLGHKNTLGVCSASPFKAVSMKVRPKKRSRLSLSLSVQKGEKHKRCLFLDNPPIVDICSSFL
ncbi:Inhibitor of growth protein 1 [Frankliniella fusca]|uniref:Inhibitor of growth protein 1 n=1 Tax=Frankliniella fusca TaxID=407009 RepID=A0AAE1LRK7_9NEOP|nr:Inhibitor of growth protein 1 [Frankliniella fusca]